MKFKFAHLADCHLGSWRQDELQKLNLESFKKAIDICINERVDFILISGDLFDSAYPPIEILKETFSEFRRIQDNKIPVFIVAGSHDFSSSGKSFLDVLEKAGFCKNIENFELTPEKLLLRPYLHNDIALFGYSGKKSSMEIEDLKKATFDSVYPFSIFMLHTTIQDVVGNVPMEYINKEKLPLANYYAMGHIHQVYESQEKGRCFVYPGPIFPNNFQELGDLECGSFELVEVDSGKIKLRNIKLKLKDIVYLQVNLEDGLTATEKIIYELDKNNLKDKIVLLKLKGVLTQGKTGDIRFDEIESFIKKKEAFSFLRNTSALETKETDLEITETKVDNIEEKIIGEYSQKNPEELNKILPRLVEVLSIEKNEDEKIVIFENRLIGELNKLLAMKV